MSSKKWLVALFEGALWIGAFGVTCPIQAQTHSNMVRAPYDLNSPLISRSISFENPTGAPGSGGKAASHLGPGRKGAPSRSIKPGETASESELIEFCRDNMAHFKCPKTVVFTELPKTSTGKIQKFVLRERAESL